MRRSLRFLWLRLIFLLLVHNLALFLSFLYTHTHTHTHTNERTQSLFHYLCLSISLTLTLSLFYSLSLSLFSFSIVENCIELVSDALSRKRRGRNVPCALMPKSAFGGCARLSTLLTHSPTRFPPSTSRREKNLSNVFEAKT